MLRFAFALFVPIQLVAQLIPSGQPIPKTSKPPVVFMDGYQFDCSSSSFSGTFGNADQVMQANGEVSLFFDNCSVAGKPSIEVEGSAFGTFLNGLRYTDGTPVDQVDIVAHSMGGLILRSYLAGKQEAEGSFTPPAVTHIRKAVLLAVPHFGSPVAILFGTDTQSNELASGSHFLFDLATWNQQNDDLRGIDAIAVVGSGGTGELITAGFDDGVAPASSASLGFAAFGRPGRTRVLPYCHIDGGGLISLAGLCSFDAQGIADLQSATQDTSRLITSFFNDTPDWQSIGAAAEDYPLLVANGGIDARAYAADGTPLSTANASVSQGTKVSALNNSNPEIYFSNIFPAGSVKVTMDAVNRNYTLLPSVYQALVVKPGPAIARITPAAAATFPLVLAPRMIVSIYGDALAGSIASATTQPLPTSLADVQLTVNGTAVGLLYVSPSQINAVLPSNATGLAQLTVQTSAGKQTVNLWVEGAFPAVFTALDATTGATTLRSGDYAEIFLTGLGAEAVNPTVSIGGAACPVSYAGPAPGYTGLDQINCQVPTGLTTGSLPLSVTVGIRTSNTVSVPVQ